MPTEQQKISVGGNLAAAAERIDIGIIVQDHLEHAEIFYNLG